MNNIKLIRAALIGGGYSEDVFIECNNHWWGTIRRCTNVNQVPARLKELLEFHRNEYKAASQLFGTAIVWHKNKGRRSITTTAEVRSHHYKFMVVLKTVEKLISQKAISIELQTI